MPDEAAALARCVGDVDHFLAAHWSCRPHHHRSGEDYGDLLSLDDVDHIVSSTGLRAPAFRLVKDGSPLAPSAYTRTARIGSRTVRDLADAGRVFGHFADGATIVLQGLQRYWPPLTAFCRQLEDQLTHPVQANAYITPPVAAGLDVHADAHDVFALQTFGHKQWVTYDGDEADLDVYLEPGECLYVPKGTRHAARTVDRASVHITIGVRTRTWTALVRGAVDRVLDDLDDEPLPPGFAQDPARLTEAVRGRLADLAERVGALDPAEIADAEGRRFHTARPPLLAGQLRQVLAADEVTDRTRVRRRSGASCDVSAVNGRVRLRLGDRTLRFPARAEATLRWVADQDTFTVADLTAHLDEEGRRVLVARLLREGLLVVDQ